MRQLSLNGRFMRFAGSALLAGTLLGGCAEDPSGAQADYAEASPVSADMEMAESASDAEATAAAPPASAASALPDIPVSMPKISYVYNYGFELPGSDIAALQKRHADLCEAQGPFNCRIVSMSHSGDTGEYANGNLQLAVAAPKARAFGEQLGTAAETAGAEQTSATIAGEDLSKQMVDTEARLKARTVLRDRLMEVLRTRRGKVSELVEAERSVARVNEEIDQARSWLEEMRTRVAFSRVDISYGSTTATSGNFIDPIKSAFGSVSTIAGTTIGGIIMLLSIVLPLGGAAYGLYIAKGYIQRKRGTLAEA